MAAWGALVLLFAVSLAGALPRRNQPTFPENTRDGVSRIVSGWEAVDGQIPYQLSLRMVAANGDVFVCGATLLDNDWALTAAHCSALTVTFIVRVGGVNLHRPSMIFETDEYYNHPLYIDESFEVQTNDISLIKLNHYVEYTPLIQPIRLQSSADKDKEYQGIRLQASGWGYLWTEGNSPVNLNWVYLSGVSNSDCRDAYDGSSVIANTTICAGPYNVTSQSTCEGDSGGPLVIVDVDGYPTQVGITSFVSSNGCHEGVPAGFVRPGYFHEWLTEVTEIDFDWDPSLYTTSGPSTEDDEFCDYGTNNDGEN